MEDSFLASLGFYCVFSVFAYYQWLQVRALAVEDNRSLPVLNISVLAAIVTGLAYLAYCTWTIGWWAPFVAVISTVLANIPGHLLRQFIGEVNSFLAAFLVWPISAYFMFHMLP